MQCIDIALYMMFLNIRVIKIDATSPIPLEITGSKHRTHKPFNLLNFIQLQYTDTHYCSDISFRKITTELKMVKIFFQISFQYSYQETLCKNIPTLGLRG